MEHRTCGELIEKVHVNEVVWDISNSKYKSKNRPEMTWLLIPCECGIEGRPAFVKAKWRHLHDTYRKKLKQLLPNMGIQVQLKTSVGNGCRR